VIAVNPPIIGPEAEDLVLQALRSGHLVKGPMIERFEAAVCEAAGAKHAVAVNSGTSALIAALLAHGVRPGDEIVTSSFTFVATVNAILFCGARPRFVDIADDFNLDPALVEREVGPATRALLPVYLYGLAADAVPRAGGDGPGHVVIADAAQALGASVRGRPVGSSGTACFSFFATKNVTTGEGGVVTTNDDIVADNVRLLRDQGQRSAYEYVRPGLNFRMTELQAALGVAQLARLNEFTAARRCNAEVLSRGLAGLEGLVLPESPADRTHVFHQYTVRVTRNARATREELRRLLAELGVGTGVYYPRPVFEYECFRADTRIGSPHTPRAAQYSKEVLSLPVHPGLDATDLERIIDGTRRCLE
jgi:dTDP-4-amino-4,6-dideoxygalactose transaminase